MSLILVTGVPGVGKTTIIRRLGEELQRRGVAIDGFYTEELRGSPSGERIGFDVITFDGKRAPLARVNATATAKQHRVGKYTVCVDEFEAVALPALDNRTTDVLLLDEIGKMEMKSSAFEKRMIAIAESVKRRELRFIATVPLQVSLGIVERLKSIPRCQLFHVKPSTRDHLYDDILQAAITMVTN